MPMSEDCLVLNVWTPGLSGERPVIVWLHGRGYNAGAGSEGWYDGTNLASHGDLVVVTINHRLNVFGYLYLGELAGGEGGAFDASGLAGLLDVQLALEWIQDNIRAFGGDPGNVTIFGESGGGSKVATMMGMPSAKGLFHKGIIQSGPSRTGTPRDEAMATARQEMFVERSTPPAAGVPLLIGSNRDEQIYFSRNEDIDREMGEADLLDLVRAMYGHDAELVIEAYRRSRPEANPWELYIAIGSARMTYGSIQLAEVRFVFRNASDRPNAMPGAATVEDAMSNAWIAFARNGDPNHPGIPEWPTYDLQDRPTLVFDVESRLVNDLRPIERQVHDRVGLRR